MDIVTLRPCWRVQGESQILTEISDKEIYQAVIDSSTARASIVETMLTMTVLLSLFPLSAILKAVSTIGKYTNDMNDPLARKIEALLGSLNRQLRLEETRGLKDAHLTDFFDQP
jgi:hypothetical protein